jgi:hypothetical protein
MIQSLLRQQLLSYFHASPVHGQTEESVLGFLRDLDARGLKLTAPEKLQLVNLRPRFAVELYLVSQAGSAFERCCVRARGQVVWASGADWRGGVDVVWLTAITMNRSVCV